MNRDRLLAKLCKFADFARSLSELSTCKRNKVGAIVFPPECTTVLAIGYNGPAHGLPNESCTGCAETLCNCAHAEANAIAKLVSRDSCSILFTTVSPCVPCANSIINCGAIRCVIYGTSYRDPNGHRLLIQSGIFVTRFIDLNDNHALSKIRR